MRAVLGVLALTAGVLSFTLAAPSAQAPAPAPAGQGAPGRGAAPAAATNLKVLPKTWTRPQVQQLMQTFNTSLGVMCTHCHVPNPNAPEAPAGRGPALDYALDVKPEKEIARGMISMVMSINERTAKLGDAAMAEKVTCYTCHDGALKPETTPEGGWGRGSFTLSTAGPVVPARGGGAAAPGGGGAPPAPPAAPAAPAGGRGN